MFRRRDCDPSSVLLAWVKVLDGLWPSPSSSASIQSCAVPLHLYMQNNACNSMYGCIHAHTNNSHIGSRFPFPNPTVSHLLYCCLLLFLIAQAREHGQHSSAVSSGALFFNFLGKIAAEEVLLSARCSPTPTLGSGFGVHVAGSCPSSNGQGPAQGISCDCSHQAPPDRENETSWRAVFVPHTGSFARKQQIAFSSRSSWQPPVKF